MSTWDVFWFLFLFIPLCILWVMMLVDLLRRQDLVGWQKAIWAMVLIFFPWIGVFAYLVMRPRNASLSPIVGSSEPAASPASSPTAMYITPGPAQAPPVPPAIPT